MLLFSLLACNPETDKEITYHGQIAPLLAEHCTSCHTAGNLAPFALDNYSTAASMADAMVDAIESGSMPPWMARNTDECTHAYPFKNDLRLNDDEIALLHSWIDAGLPEGDPNTATALPTPPSLEIENPDTILEFPVDYIVEGDQDDFQCFVLDPGNTVPTWITELQLVPGNTKVDHHGLIFVDIEGQSPALSDTGVFQCFNAPDIPYYQIGTWTPGAVPNIAPPTAGLPLPVGARIVVQMHYHPSPNGPETDRSQVQIKWTTETPTWEAANVLVGNLDNLEDNGSGLQPDPDDRDGAVEFRIPAQSTNHTETMIYSNEIPIDLPIYSVATHMHYVGTDMKIELQQSDGDHCLLQTPDWDFNWQRAYDFDEAIEDLPTITAGDSLNMRCTYNNTMDNPFVAAALTEKGITETQDVYLGESTTDEMCLGIYGVLVPPGLIQALF